MYQFTKTQSTATQEKLEELLTEKSAFDCEVRLLKDRIKALKTEADLERSNADGMVFRLEASEKKYRSQRLDNEDLNRLKDERIKALIEENNNLASSLQKIAAKCLAGSLGANDSLSKKVSNVEAICEELKRDKRLVQKFESAFKKIEDKIAHLQEEVERLRGENDTQKQDYATLKKEYYLLLQRKTELEDQLDREQSLQTIK